MQDILVVVDMQNDFIDGALGTPEAVAIVPRVKAKIEGFQGTVLYTRDTHTYQYMNTQEGRNLPVPHCIKDTFGWQIREELDALRKTEPIDKVTFGSSKLGQKLQEMDQTNKINSITFIGLCTDICVISNVMIAKAFLPEVPIIVDADCCAGVSPATHRNALEAMKVCQVQVLETEVKVMKNLPELAPYQAEAQALLEDRDRLHDFLRTFDEKMDYAPVKGTALSYVAYMVNMFVQYQRQSYTVKSEEEMIIIGELLVYLDEAFQDIEDIFDDLDYEPYITLCKKVIPFVQEELDSYKVWASIRGLRVLEVTE